MKSIEINSNGWDSIGNGWYKPSFSLATLDFVHKA
jgi:hypothetical protein